MQALLFLILSMCRILFFEEGNHHLCIKLLSEKLTLVLGCSNMINKI